MWLCLSQQDVPKALACLNLLFDNGKSMTRFVTDLLHYLRDLLIVQTGGENTHHSPVFVENLALPQENLFEMIRLATVSLADIKSSLQPKIYAEMMTIRLARLSLNQLFLGQLNIRNFCIETRSCPSQTRARQCGNCPKANKSSS